MNKLGIERENGMSRGYLVSDPSQPYADGVFVNKTLYLAGMIGVLAGTRSVPEDPVEEAHLLMQKLTKSLELASLTVDHLVSVQVFCPDVSLWSTFNEVYRNYFSSTLPPRAFIGSGALLFGARFELQAVAVAD